MIVSAKKRPSGMVQIPWGVLLPNPDDPGTRITYGNTTCLDTGKPTRTTYRLYARRKDLVDLLERATAAGCCVIAVRHLRDLLGIA